jgi:hypothetical protein
MIARSHSTALMIALLHCGFQPTPPIDIQKKAIKYGNLLFVKVGVE